MADHSHWNPYHQVTFATQTSKKLPKTDKYAVDFTAWATKVFATVLAAPEFHALKLAKLQLVEKYFALMATVPKVHKAAVYAVFVGVYNQLHEKELFLDPPQWFVQPESQTRVEVVDIPGIPIGRIIKREKE